MLSVLMMILVNVLLGWLIWWFSVIVSVLLCSCDVYGWLM